MIAGELEGKIAGPWSIHRDQDYDHLFGSKKRKAKRAKEAEELAAQLARNSVPGRMVRIAAAPFSGISGQRPPEQLPPVPKPKPIPVDKPAPQPEEISKSNLTWRDVKKAQNMVNDGVAAGDKIKQALDRNRDQTQESDYEVSVGAPKEGADTPPAAAIPWGWIIGGTLVAVLLVGGVVALKASKKKAALAAAQAAAKSAVASA